MNNNNAIQMTQLLAGTSTTTSDTHKLLNRRSSLTLSRNSYCKKKNVLLLSYRDTGKVSEFDLNILKRMNKTLYAEVKTWINSPGKKLSNKAIDLITLIGAKKRLNYKNKNYISELFMEIEAAIAVNDHNKVYKYDGCDSLASKMIPGKGLFSFGVNKQGTLASIDIIETLKKTAPNQMLRVNMIAHSRGCFATLDACQKVKSFLKQNPQYQKRLNIALTLHDPVSGNYQNTVHCTGKWALTNQLENMMGVTCIDSARIILQSTGAKPINSSPFLHNHGYAILNKCFSGFLPRFHPNVNQSISLKKGSHGALQAKPVDVHEQTDNRHPYYRQYKKNYYCILKKLKQSGVKMNGDLSNCTNELAIMKNYIEKITYKETCFDFRKLHQGWILRKKSKDTNGFYHYHPLVFYHPYSRKTNNVLKKDLRRCGKILHVLLRQENNHENASLLHKILMKKNISIRKMQCFLVRIEKKHRKNKNINNVSQAMKQINQAIALQRKLTPFMHHIDNIKDNSLHQSMQIVMTTIIQNGYKMIANGTPITSTTIEKLFVQAENTDRKKHSSSKLYQPLDYIKEKIECDKILLTLRSEIEKIPYQGLKQSLTSLLHHIDQTDLYSTHKNMKTTTATQNTFTKIAHYTKALLEKYHDGELSMQDIQYYQKTAHHRCNKNNILDIQGKITHVCLNLGRALFLQLPSPLAFFHGNKQKEARHNMMKNLTPCANDDKGLEKTLATIR